MLTSNDDFPTSSTEAKILIDGIKNNNNNSSSQTNSDNSAANLHNTLDGFSESNFHHSTSSSSSLSEPPQLTYTLEVVQHPTRARMSGAKIRDRRYLDPPPIVRLHVSYEGREYKPSLGGAAGDDLGLEPGVLNVETLVLFASLWLPTLSTVAGGGMFPLSGSGSLVGEPVTEGSLLDGGVEHEGNSASVIPKQETPSSLPQDTTTTTTIATSVNSNTIPNSNPTLPPPTSNVSTTSTTSSSTTTSVRTSASLSCAVSDLFTVYSPKSFPGLSESTLWSKCFAKQGVPIHIRPTKDDEDDGTCVGGGSAGAGAGGAGGVVMDPREVEAEAAVNCHIFPPFKSRSQKHRLRKTYALTTKIKMSSAATMYNGDDDYVHETKARKNLLTHYFSTHLADLDHHKLYTSHHVTPIMLFLYRMFAATYTLVTLLAFFALPQPWTRAVFFTFFTHMSWLGLSIYFWVSAIMTFTYTRHNHSIQFSTSRPSWLTWIHWNFYTLAATFQPIVVLMYWTTLSGPLFRPRVPVSEIINNVNFHLVGLVLLSVEFFLGRTPLYYSQWMTVLVTSGLYLAYVAFSNAVFSGSFDRKKNPDGFWPYDFLNLRSDMAKWVVPLLGLGALFVFVLVVTAHKLRDRRRRKAGMEVVGVEGKDLVGEGEMKPGQRWMAAV
ncbi:hypothetical protein HDV05_007290 [Chytridiales sp. JEL 0842]|nr:hypothetical protein HDV05_007290 [Chytridiales sp. JEL 0842]